MKILQIFAVIVAALIGVYWPSLQSRLDRVGIFISEWPVLFGLLMIPLGTLLYIIRCRYLVWYATGEIAFGVATAFAAIVPGEGVQLIPLMVALYVMVRGYDNIYKALLSDKHKELHEVGEAWDRCFYGKKVQGPATAQVAR